ncbi:hypothetical protein CRUP_013171 [Coryphaenoides rupestris]|nr:hypothetical protein CRUP_013171 [Coryphaenoides rupestris]
MEPRPSTYGANPFDDDEDDDEDGNHPADTESSVMNIDPKHLGAATTYRSSSSKSRSLKASPAPTPPVDREDKRMTHSRDVVSSGWGLVSPPPAPGPTQDTEVELSETHPSPSHRSHPVVALSPWKQQSASGGSNAPPGTLEDLEVRPGALEDLEATPAVSHLTRGELVALLSHLQKQLTQRDSRITELEDYIDQLLLRILEEEPSILLSLNSSSHI